MFKQLPNTLTAIRFLLIPAFVVQYFSHSPTALMRALAIFVLAAITDVLDGYIARRFQLVTPLGTLLDPLADKLMLLTALLCLFIDHRLPWYILAIVAAKELAMIGGAAMLYFKREKHVVAANGYGKAATAAFTLAVVIILLQINQTLGLILLAMAVVLSVLAFLNYLLIYKAL